MTWSLPAAWVREFSRGNVPVQALVTVGLQPYDSFEINNYATAVGSGLTITFAGHAAVEGVNWTAATSNLTTANSIITYLYSVETAGVDTFRFKAVPKAGGSVVVLCFNAEDPTPAVTLSSQLFGIVDASIGPSTALFALADNPIAGVLAPPSIREIRGLELTVDPITRQFSCNKVEIEFVDDGLIRRLASQYMMVGRYVDIALGSENLSTANFASWPRLYIDEVRTLPNNAGILVTASDTSENLRDTQVSRAYCNEHPLHVLTDLFDLCGVAYDTSMDPADAANDSIGHYVVSRYGDTLFGVSTAISSPTSALEIVNSLLPILGGTIRPAQDGDLTFVVYDADAPSVRTFTHTEDPGQFPCSVESTDPGQAQTVNSVTISFCRTKDGESETFRQIDRKSIGEHGRALPMTIDLDWCNGKLFPVQSGDPLIAALNTVNMQDFSDTGGAAATEVSMFYASRQGFCGSRFRNDTTSTTIEPWAELNGTDKLAYLMITLDDYNLGIGASVTTEAVACDEVLSTDPRTDVVSEVNWRVEGGLTVATLMTVRDNIPLKLEYQIASGYNDIDFTAGRGGFGTTVHGNMVGKGAVDVTIPYAVATRLLRRLKYGAPTVVIRAPLRHFDLECGDVVQLDDPDLFIGFLLDDATLFYEITRKTVRAFEDEPCIEFELTFLRAEDNPVYEAVDDFEWEEAQPVTSPEPDTIVTNAGDPVWTDFDGDGAIEVGDDFLIRN